MDVVLLAQFQRVEAALSTLVESIASYNPSPQAALDLVAADDELSHGLDELARHQANHARILALRAQDHALEEQLKASISALADLRHELLETPATAFSADSRSVPFDELLQFAKNIAKYTVPPTYRERPPRDDDDDDHKVNDASSGRVSSNGLGTPAIANAPPIGEDPAKDGATEPAVAGEPEPEPPNPAAEQDDWLTQLQKDKGRVWFPWPTDDKIHAGNLMRIQSLLDEGKNPEDINIHDEAEKEQKRVEEEQQRQEAAMQAQEPQMPSAEPVNPTRAAPRPSQAPEVFAGFEDFDDD